MKVQDDEILLEMMVSYGENDEENFLYSLYFLLDAMDESDAMVIFKLTHYSD